jgi:hypothetical protein
MRSSRAYAFSVALALAVGLVTSGCAHRRPAVPAGPPTGRVSAFSSAVPGDPPPPGWYAAAAARFRSPTRYETVDDNGTTVILASAKASSSGLAYNLSIDPRKCPHLRWRWKVPRLIPGADNTQRALEDAPARIDLAFAGDLQSLPFAERMFFSEVKALSGIEIPYATLDYIWGNGAPAGTVILNTWTSRIRMLLVRSGAERLGDWITEERNVYQDFKDAFGEEPGRITQIAIYTDSDATGEEIQAYYGDIRFLPEQGSQAPAEAGGATCLAQHD